MLPNPRGSGAASRLPRPKRVAFSLILIALILAAVETASFVFYGMLVGRGFSWAEAQDDRAGVIQQYSPDSASGPPQQVIHPYLGYVSNPDRAPGLSQYGYPKSTHLFNERSDDRVVIAVVGGSVAQSFAATGMPAIVEALRRAPHFAGKEIAVVDLAVGGYKQPQQLMTLGYLLSLGYQFDIVLNIDGFNEVALHAAENGMKHVFPAYPRGWYLRVANVPVPALRVPIGRVASFEADMLRTAEAFSGSPWRWSATSNLIWRLRQDWLSGRHMAALATLNHYKPLQSPYLMTGPHVDFDSEDQLYEHLVSIWKRSSLQLDRLCRANGILYYHFLQPNQYVFGSKRLTLVEQTQAFTADHPYRVGVQHGYPLLIRAGAELRDEGVQFVDLTRVFADEDSTLYVDDCCHVNELGNLLIADQVTSRLLSD